MNCCSIWHIPSIVAFSATAALGLAALAPHPVFTPGTPLNSAPAIVTAETPQEQLARLESEYDAALTRATQLSAQLDARIAEAKASNASYEKKQTMLASIKLLAKQAQTAQSDAAYKKLSWQMAQSQLGGH